MRRVEDTKRVIRIKEGQTTQWTKDTKRVIRICKSNDSQHNGQKKKNKRTNNDQQNIANKIKIE